MDIRLALMCGTDIPVPECQLFIHQPRIKEIALIGERDFFSGAQCFCITKNMISSDESVLQSINNFQIFMTVMQEKEGVEKKMQVQQLCTLLFPHYKVIFTPRSILFQTDTGSILIDENNFDYLQEKIRQVCCLRSSATGSHTLNPASKKAQEIADKLMQGRHKIAQEKGESDVSIFSQYLSILTVGIQSMSLQDLMDLTIYQLYDLIERYSLYTNWDLDIRSRLAGAKPDKQPDNWMKNIH